jgi:hypothetical protein
MFAMSQRSIVTCVGYVVPPVCRYTLRAFRKTQFEMFTRVLMPEAVIRWSGEFCAVNRVKVTVPAVLMLRGLS